MERVDIEKPIRLTRGFWTIYLVLILPVLWLTAPLYRDLPLYAQIAWILVLPFLAAVVCYCTLHFVLATVTGSSAEKRRARLWVVAILMIALLRIFFGTTLPELFR